MSAENVKAKDRVEVADNPEAVTLADILAEVRRGNSLLAEIVAAVGAAKDRLESIRRVLFYIPEVAEGVRASKDKKAQAEKAEGQNENTNT